MVEALLHRKGKERITETMKYSYYPGCTLKNKAKDLDAYARVSARALGFELEEIEDWQCCGGVYPLGSDELPRSFLLYVLSMRQRKRSGSHHRLFRLSSCA